MRIEPALALWILVGTACSHTSPYVISPDVVTERVPDERIRHRVLLFGDGGAPSIDEATPAGELYKGDPTLTSLHWWARRMPQKTTILFLGDNIYEVGLPEEGSKGYEKAERRLQAQLSVVKASGAHGIFIPGNHDWADGGKGGWAAVLRQEAYVDSVLGTARPSYLPGGGRPGPEKVDKDGVRIIALDTQWWLHRDDDKPMDLNGRVIEELRGLLDGSGSREVIVAGHHPLATHGPHGGVFDWQHHLFPLTKLPLSLLGWVPLPVAGSMYPLGRWNLYRSDQDLNGSRNRMLVGELKKALAGEHRPLIYAAGHDHSLQVLSGAEAADYILVSGSGSRMSNVSHGKDTLFAHEHLGFMAVDFVEDARVLLRVVEPTGQRPAGEVVFSKWLR